MKLFGRNPPEIYTTGAILGVKDERDWDFPRLADMVERGDALPVSWETPVIYSQDPDACVGYSILTLCESSSLNADANPALDSSIGTRLYQRAREIGNLTPEIKGAIIRDGMKAAQEMGLISFYARGTWEQATEWLDTKGPILFGLPWYDRMFYPKRGVLDISGAYAGGHAICCNGDNLTPADRRLVNTWGLHWGLEGCGYIEEQPLHQIFTNQGEVWTAIRVLDPVPHWPDLPTMNEDDLKSQDACYLKGVFLGYPDGSFRPGEPVSIHQVGTVLVRLGLKKSNPWNRTPDYTMPAMRGWVHEQVPQLVFNETDRWMENLNRFQLMLLIGRYLRGV